MLTAGVAFFIALALAYLLTPVTRDFALQKSWVCEQRSFRDVHETPVPRIGGVAIVIAFNAPILGLFVVESAVGRILLRDHSQLIALMGGGVAIACLGVYDDLKGTNAWQKFAFQISVAVVMWTLGVRIDRLSWFADGTLELGVLSLPFTVLWIVGIINALNLVDGLDGLASGVALVAIIPSLVVSIYAGNALMMLFMAALAGAILGFLRYNFNPASIFMGDTGSMFLGLVLSTGSILANEKSSAVVSMITPILALGLPIMDTLLAMFRRSVAGASLFTADRDHIHHRLLDSGLSPRQAVLGLYGISLLFAAGALGAAFINGWQTALLLLSVSVLVGALLRRLGYVSLASRIALRKKRAAQASLQEMRRTLEGADEYSSVWNVIEPVRDHLGLHRFELALDGERFSSTSDRENNRGTTIGFSIGITVNGTEIGELTAKWQESREAVSRKETILLLELVANSVTTAAERLLAVSRGAIH